MKPNYIIEDSGEVIFKSTHPEYTVEHDGRTITGHWIWHRHQRIFVTLSGDIEMGPPSMVGRRLIDVERETDGIHRTRRKEAAEEATTNLFIMTERINDLNRQIAQAMSDIDEAIRLEVYLKAPMAREASRKKQELARARLRLLEDELEKAKKSCGSQQIAVIDVPLDERISVFDVRKEVKKVKSAKRRAWLIEYRRQQLEDKVKARNEELQAQRKS